MKKEAVVAIIAGILTVIPAWGGAYITSTKVAKQVSKETIIYEIDKLKVSSAGSVNESGVVQYIKDVPFTATKIAIGKIRVNFSLPFEDNVPIVVATAHKQVANIHIQSVDRTGFTAKGNAISDGRDEDTAFSFIVVEPNAK